MRGIPWDFWVTKILSSQLLLLGELGRKGSAITEGAGPHFGSFLSTIQINSFLTASLQKIPQTWH